ncbi:hypothetical protein HYT04_01855 [Candidatus Kaiserbacteria bacterium]|nr:hypothetical protein [Candidatus Kaiserbacteria bacterium]MBI4079959.1 hypothetical protein [Candidatus Kaiserbacteria bacterium]
MLSVFPEILFLSPLAPFLIRVALGIIFGLAGWTHFQRQDIASRGLSVVEFVIAIALVVGAWTQPAALLASIVTLMWLFQPTSRVYARSTVLLSLIMALSLIVTGAGAFAFDLPL